LKKKRLDTLDLIQHITVITGIVSIAYLFVLFVVIARKGSPTTTNMPFEGVSIIIAAHNELDNLKVHIDSIFNQSYPRFEVIVVCDRCTDGSVEFLQSIKHKSLIIKDLHTFRNDPVEEKSLRRRHTMRPISLDFVDRCRLFRRQYRMDTVYDAG
jgi:cellulose synthase/poly-beta-1,6-N-acetylglucosamine synthase-like glycosyltransferase